MAAVCSCVRGPQVTPTSPTTRRRFRPRFRLRSILILVTIFCVWLGWHIHGTRRQREIVRLVRECQGLVCYDYERRGNQYDPAQRSWVPDGALRFFGPDFFHSVVEVDFVMRPMDDPEPLNPHIEPALNALSGLRGLEELEIGGAQVTDANLAHVARVQGLRKLFLFDAANLTDAGVAHLASLQRLTRLYIDAPQITDASLAVVSRLPELEEIAVSSGQFSDEGLEQLCRIRRIRMISIDGLDIIPSMVTEGFDDE